MPSLVEGDDRQTVKRVVPKASNKIQAVAIVKLYVAHPNRSRWTYTGLQGAAVLANDLVGSTYWIKLVDVSPANRGVIWDQEIYDTFQYNQDRVFFHTFELEDCMAGFSFADDKEARKFKEKMDAREKNAHKNTKSKPFGNAAGAGSGAANGEHHSRLGRFGGLLHRDRASSGASAQPAQSIIPPKEISISRPPKDQAFENIDPQLLQQLKNMGLTEDQLAENADFIKIYIEQNAASTNAQRSRPPPPPAPISPQDTGASRRGPAPAPPPARRSGAAPATPDSPVRNTPSPPAGSRFRAPPPLADAGKFARDIHTGRSRASSNVGHPGPPPPPRPPKTPMDEEDANAPKFGIPPPFMSERQVPAPPPRGAAGPPPPPSRGPVPPAPPARDYAGPVHMVPPAAALTAPPLPPKTPNAPATHAAGPPPPPARDIRAVPPPPSAGLPPPPPSRNSVPPPPPLVPSSSNRPPPPPPMPSASNGPPPPPPMPSLSNGPPPPPPMPAASGGPPPPPPMPNGGANAPPLPVPPPGVNGLLGEIRGGARLKKVSDSEKRDRSAAAVPGATSAPAPGGAPAPPSGDQGGLAGALASALAARKSKVSQSDDEDDKDDW